MNPAKLNNPSSPCSGHLCPSQDPHEEELYNVRVEEEELRSLVTLRSRVGLHGAACVVVCFGEEDVFQGSHLWLLAGCQSNSMRGVLHTRNKELAKNV